MREAARGRKTIIVAENEPQINKLMGQVESGGYGLDALWNDDFHHSATVALTGRNEACYTDYLGKPQEFISMVKYGYLYQGRGISGRSNAEARRASGCRQQNLSHISRITTRLLIRAVVNVCSL